jgi:hypothetical protein
MQYSRMSDRMRGRISGCRLVLAFTAATLMLVLVAISHGCGGEPDCRAAAQKLESCGLVRFVEQYDLDACACEDIAACIAECVEAKSCEELEDSITGGGWTSFLCAGEGCGQIGF